MSGYYQMARGWMDNEFFSSEPFTEREAWIWMIEACCYRLTSRDCLAQAERTECAVLPAKWLSGRFLWTRSRTVKFIRSIADSGVFSVTDLGEEVYQIGLPEWRKHVQDLPNNPSIASMPCWMPPPPPDRRRVASSDRVAILARGSCRYCGTTSGPFHIDHVKPFSRGGSNHRSNLALACRSCNLSKAAKPLSKWSANHV